MNRKIGIPLFCATAFLQGMVFYGPIATLYRQARGVSVFQITLIESISLACLIALEIPWGYVADRIGYRRTLAACNVLYFLSKIGFWRAEGFGGFLLERLMLSAVLSGLSGCDSAYLFSLAGEGESQKAFGAYEASATAGLVAASLLFSTAVGGDFDAAGFLTVLSYGAAMVLTFFLPEVPPPARRSAGFGTRAGEAAREVWDNRRFLLFLAAAALLTESNQTITVFLSQLQYVRAGVPARAMGYLFIPLTLMGLFAAFPPADRPAGGGAGPFGALPARRALLRAARGNRKPRAFGGGHPCAAAVRVGLRAHRHGGPKPAGAFLRAGHDAVGLLERDEPGRGGHRPDLRQARRGGRRAGDGGGRGILPGWSFALHPVAALAGKDGRLARRNFPIRQTLHTGTSQ